MLGEIHSRNQWVEEPFMLAENRATMERTSPSQKDLIRLSRNFEKIEFDFNKEVMQKKDETNHICDQVTEKGSCADSIEEFLMTPAKCSPFPSERAEPFESRLNMAEEGNNDDIRSFASSEEEAEEVDFGQFVGFFDANPSSSSSEETEEEPSSQIGSIDLETGQNKKLPDSRIVYQTESTGTKSNFPLFIFDEKSQREAKEVQSLGLKKVIKKTSTLKNKKKRGRKAKKNSKSKAQAKKKAFQVSWLKNKTSETWKKSSLSEQNLSLTDLMLKSKRVNENAGVQMNKLLQNYMKCVEEDIRHRRLVERRKEIVKKKQQQMLRILQKRKVIHQKIEKVFREE